MSGADAGAVLPRAACAVRARAARLRVQPRASEGTLIGVVAFARWLLLLLLLLHKIGCPRSCDENMPASPPRADQCRCARCG